MSVSKMGSVVSNATKSARLVRPVAVWTLRPTNGTVSLFFPLSLPLPLPPSGPPLLPPSQLESVALIGCLIANQ